MNFVLQPWQLLLAILAGWSNRQQQEIIEYLLLFARPRVRPPVRRLFLSGFTLPERPAAIAHFTPSG
jgi:hypothetical protein